MKKTSILIARITFACSLLTPLLMDAQTRFSWPDDPIDFKRYQYWERCNMMITRVSDSLALEEVLWRDTLHHSVPIDQSGISANLASLAQKCLLSVPAKDTLVNDALNVHPLLLIANQDSLARALIDKKLSSFDGKQSDKAAYVLDSAIRNLTRSTPSRLAEAQLLFQRLLELGDAAPSMAVLPAIGSILNTAIRSDHLEDIAYGLNEIVGLAKRVSDEEWSGRIGLYISMLYNFNIY